MSLTTVKSQPGIVLLETFQFYNYYPTVEYNKLIFQLH